MDGVRHPRLPGELGAVPRRDLLPTLQAGVDGGFIGPPQEMAFEVATETSASTTA